MKVSCLVMNSKVQAMYRYLPLEVPVTKLQFRYIHVFKKIPSLDPIGMVTIVWREDSTKFVCIAVTFRQAFERVLLLI